jgi:hypothetical protein
MTTSKTKTFFALSVAVLTAMLVAQIAGATHPRPKGATPIRVSLVPAYKACAAPGNRTHGAPLAFPSCNPPVQTSNYLTVGTPDANGAAANSVGYILIKVKGTSPEDLLGSGVITDVRCRPGTAASVCGTANVAGGPDYSGELQSNAVVRTTDHYNGPNLDEAATVVDGLYIPMNFYCQPTADTSVGATCSGSIYNPLPGPQWFEGQRVVVELGQLQVSDGGPDGQVNTDDNTLFMKQGVFIP